MNEPIGGQADPPAPAQSEASDASEQNGAGREDQSQTVASSGGAPDTADVASSKGHSGRDWSWSQVLMGVGGMATVIIAFAGIYFGIGQVEESDRLQKETNRLQRAQLDSHLEEVMMNLDRYFASHPELRPFFFAIGHRERFPPKGPLLAPAMGTAEMVIDFADDVGAYAEMRKMDPSDSAHWRRIVSGYFEESPVTRLMWKLLHGSYNEPTACILRAPIRRAKLRHWHWRANSPREVVQACS